MKAGIITFHRAINYGAILQTYALHKVLKENFKVDNNVINYYCEYLEKEFNVISRYKYCGNYKGKILFTINLLSYIIKKTKFRIFLRNNILLSNIRIITKDKISDKNINDNYDIFITGSDQVWNFKHTKNDTTYFLDFVKANKKKKSYAASFGFDEIPQEDIPNYKKFLSSFSDISVRESQGTLIINQLFNSDVPVVLDPTLLVDKDKWVKLCKNRVKIKNYILVFGISFSPSLRPFAKELQNKTGCNIAIINDKIIENFKLIHSLGIGPEEFIELFIKARYVITNSFHGTAFSIIFRKDFFVELQPSSSGNTNSRINNLLDIFDLKERVLINGRNENCLTPVNYENIDNKFEKERKKSLDYLKKITTM